MVRRLRNIILLALVLTMVLGGVVHAEEGVKDVSLSAKADELGRVFGTALAYFFEGDGSESAAYNIRMAYAIDGGGSEPSGYLNAGNAGGLLGYSDKHKDDKGVTGWFTSTHTGSSTTVTYEQLKSVLPELNTDSFPTNNPFYHYAGYGLALNKAGFAKPISPGTAMITRGIPSLLMLLVYLISQIAPFFFSISLWFVGALNPFQLFAGVWDVIADGGFGILSTSAQYVSDIYKAVQNLSLHILVPMMLILTVLSILIFRQPQGGASKKVWRYALRIFLILGGLPLIGGTYTGIVDGLSNNINVGSTYADYMILSSYVDFEGWVRHNRLAPLEGDAFKNVIRHPKVIGDDVQDKIAVANRGLILQINDEGAGLSVASDIRDKFSIGGVSGAFDVGNDDVIGVDSDSRISRDSVENSRIVRNILTRHASGSVYSGSQYNSEVMGQIQKEIQKATGDNKKQIIKMMSLSEDEKQTMVDSLINGTFKWGDAQGLFTLSGSNHPNFKFGDYQYTIYNSGGLDRSAISFYKMAGGSSSNNPSVIGTDSTAIGGLSPLAMFNFLNTSFTDSSLIIYSGDKAPSEVSRDFYASVAFGGSGVIAITRYLENIIVILCMSFVTMFFGFTVLRAVVQNIPRILSGVFGTGLGSIQMATKLLISTGLLIVQMLGMIFLYYLTENIIISVIVGMDDILAPASDYFGFINLSGIEFALNSGSFLTEFAQSIFTIFLTFSISFFMVRNLNTFRELIEEVISNSINRVMGVLDTSTGGRGLDISKTSGGRLDGSGNLTEGAMADNSRLLGGAAGAGLIGGAWDAMAQAHDIESRKEDINERLGEGKGSGLDRALARAKTAKDLGKAKAKDNLKKSTGLGLDTGSHQRALDAKREELEDLRRRGATAGGIKDSRTNASGQQVDEHNNVITDGAGDAKDKDGNTISSHASLATNGREPMKAENGAIMDINGDNFTDEMGNTLYVDADGNLTDDVGNYIAIGEDGTAQAVEDVYGEGAGPVNANDEANKLNNMRLNSENYANMKEAQNATHRGINSKGAPVDMNGKALTYKDENGQVRSAKLNRQGQLVDHKGKALSSSQLSGKVDPKAYKTVTDANGQRSIQHNGDSAMKHQNSFKEGDNQNHQDIAQQAVKARYVADRAQKHIDTLKKLGAPAYAIEQAERYAQQAQQKAQATQTRFGNMIRSADNKNMNINSISQDHVRGASNYANEKKAEVDRISDQLAIMKKGGYSLGEIEKQQQLLTNANAELSRANTIRNNMQIANRSGRSYGEVQQAQSNLDWAEKAFTQTQSAYLSAIENGRPEEVIERHRARMNAATKQLDKNSYEMNRVSQRPAGSPEDIKRYEAYVTNYQDGLNRAQKNFNNVQATYAPNTPQYRQAEQNYNKLKSRHNQAVSRLNTLKNPKGWDSNVNYSVLDTSPNTIDESKVELIKNNVSDFDSYSRKVKQQQESIKAVQLQINHAENQLENQKRGNRPKQTIKATQQKINQLKQNLNQQTDELNSLQSNAQGLLLNGDFQPRIANKPILYNGGEVSNRLSYMNYSQKAYEKLQIKQKGGPLSQEEQGNMKRLQRSISIHKKELVSMGIDPKHIVDSNATSRSTSIFRQAWESYINGDRA